MLVKRGQGEVLYESDDLHAIDVIRSRIIGETLRVAALGMALPDMAGPIMLRACELMDAWRQVSSDAPKD